MNAKIFSTKLRLLRAELDKVVIGYEVIKDMIILTILARGNVLLRAVPGTAKTTLIAALQKTIENIQVSRIQLNRTTNLPTSPAAESGIRASDNLSRSGGRR